MPRLSLLVLLYLVLPGSVPATGTGDEQAALVDRSPIAMVASDDGVLYVAESAARTIAVVDLKSGRVAGRITLPDQPTGLAIAPSGELIATAGMADGQVLRVDPSTGSVAVLADHLHWPTAPVFNAHRQAIYVADRFANRVVVLDRHGKRMDEIPVGREPCAMEVARNGATLVVAHELPAGRADVGYVAATVSLIDLQSRKVHPVVLPNGSNGLRDVCVDPEGQLAYVTHVLARYRLPAMQLERGWMNTNAVSVIDLKAARLVNTVLLDEIDRGAANPWGIACSSDGKSLCIAHAGTQELSVIDRADLHRKLADVESGKAVTVVSDVPENVPNDLAFLVGSRRRVPLDGNGARAVTVVGTTAIVGMYFTDQLSIVDLSSPSPRQHRTIELGGAAKMTLVREGEMHFHDASLCFQTWQSCASCHPSQGRADGLNWDLLNDGIGNPKNTKSLLLSHQTPPVMSTGVRPDAETAVRSGLRHIQFTVRPESEARAIDAYLKSLTAVPSPHLQGGQLSESAKRGEQLFESAGCIRCHSGPAMTNGAAYDVGTGRGPEEKQLFDTPTLIEVWRTAPYLHDGRSATIREVLTVHNPDDRHGATSKLSQQQVDDLQQYLLSK